MEVASLYSVVSELFGIVTTIFTGYCLAYYFDSFMDRKNLFWGYGKYIVIIFYVICDYLLDGFFPTAFETKYKELKSRFGIEEFNGATTTSVFQEFYINMLLS